MIKKEDIQAIIEGWVQEHGFDLYDLSVRWQRNAYIVVIIVDRIYGGILLEECTAINRGLVALFDENQKLGEFFSLEVSSPGLDRPLVLAKDFIRCRNRLVRFYLSEKINDKLQWDGRIKSVEEDNVVIILEGTEAPLEIPLRLINKAVQIIQD